MRDPALEITAGEISSSPWVYAAKDARIWVPDISDVYWVPTLRDFLRQLEAMGQTTYTADEQLVMTAAMRKLLEHWQGGESGEPSQLPPSQEGPG